MKTEKFWKIRSVQYDEIEWVKDQSYLDILTKLMRLKKNDFVLDVGTGTGVVAHQFSTKVKEIIGMDISSDMMNLGNWKGNQYFFQWDIREPIFKNDVFDKIVARMVFHHITERTQDAVNECHRIIKKGGIFGIAEGVPPTERTKSLYMEIFKHKEERLTFFETDLINYLKKAGFKDLKVNIYEQDNMSIKDWLKKSGLPSKKQELIFDLHINAPDYFKEDYNMIEKDDDCYVTFKSAIVTGTK